MKREEFLNWLVSDVVKWGNFPASTHNFTYRDGGFINLKYDPITIHDWNRAKIKPNTKIRIESPEHSEYVQKLAFEAGFEWRDGRGVRKPCGIKWLFFNDGVISLSGVEETGWRVKYEEIHIEMPKTEPTDINAKVLAEKMGSKHSHYFKDVSDLDEVDVYRVCDLFDVDDASGATQHAIKKLLCSGKRGVKDKRKDLEEARDTIIRKLQIMDEDK